MGKEAKNTATDKDWFEKEYQFLMKQYEADHSDPFVNFLMGGVLVNLNREALAARHYKLFLTKAHGQPKLRPFIAQAEQLIDQLEGAKK